MPFEYLSNTPLDEAISQYRNELRSQGLTYQVETIETRNALGRMSARAVYAKICAPHYNACAMDGIALISEKTYGATETTPVRLTEEDFTWVDTGDPLPKGCDSVIMIEDLVEDQGSHWIYSPAVPWQNIRQIGEDISAGDMIIPSFTRITPACMGAMLAAGVLRVAVIKKPLVAIIPTGEEIVPPTEDPGEGDVIEFNSTIFAGMLTEWGCNPKIYPIVSDNRVQIQKALQSASQECDAVILIAGSSAGRDDYSAQVIRETGQIVLHGIAIKPGKPAILAYINEPLKNRCVPVIGMPGYPVSGIIVMEMVFKPIIQLLTCQPSEKKPVMDAAVSRRINSSLKNREFIRTRIGWVNGKTVAVPLNRGAGVVSSFVKADGLMDIPQNSEGVEAGGSVKVRLLEEMEIIMKSLVITGSHDPLLDEAADILRREFPEAKVSSSHVGSMGCITALQRGEAHMGGIHLLDEETGTYNIPYLKKYFPKGNVVLIECVQRTQGIMTAKGNPKNIKGFDDIIGKEYVNRQKGSGTRILCDYLIKQNNLDMGKISGYQREEFTHTAVAAAIAAGTADAGLGILSAAKIYDLDFIPIADESYDLLVGQKEFELDIVKKFIEVLKSREFAERLNAMGGYKLNQPGRIIDWT